MISHTPHRQFADVPVVETVFPERRLKLFHAKKQGILRFDVSLLGEGK